MFYQYGVLERKERSDEPLIMAMRIPAIPLTTAVSALPIARKTDLIYLVY